MNEYGDDGRHGVARPREMRDECFHEGLNSLEVPVVGQCTTCQIDLLTGFVAGGDVISLKGAE